MANIIGTNGNDTLYGSYNDTLTGGGGKDIYYVDYDDTYTITDFGGIGKGVNPSAAVIAEVDTLNFQGDGLTARNLLLTQNGNNLEITFEAEDSPKIILQNFALENLDNLSKSTGASVNLGNILFNGQTSITDSFDVFNANSTQNTIFNKNTVTFLNDLSNNVNGFDNSDDVINGQGGDDKIDGKSGNDLLRGGTGNNTLIGGAGNDILDVEFSTGDNTLNGDTGNDTLDAGASKGNNLLSGGDGNDFLDTSYISPPYTYTYFVSSGNNTLNGGAGNDTLNAQSPSGNNLLSGGDGNDFLDTSGVNTYRGEPNFSSSGNNTLNGGAGNDYLDATISTGNNLLSGGDGNDTLSTSSGIGNYADYIPPSSGNNTLNGGAGDDYLDATISIGNNLLSGGDGNDSFYVGTALDSAPSYLVTQTVDGGKGDDLLSVDYSFATRGITSTFNPTTNIGSITAGTYRVSYKDIEGLNISGTAYDDNIVGSSGNDTLSGGTNGKDTIDGGKGDDVLSVNYSYSNATGGITTTFNATTNIGEITAGKNRVSYKNIEQLNISGTAYDDNIVGNSGNDTLSVGTSGKDTIDGGKGDDVLSVDYTYTNTGVGITTTFNATTNIGEITAGTNRVSYKNIERLNISGTAYDDNIVGNSGNDTLFGGYGNDTIIGGAGNDILTGGDDTNILTGGAGNDEFVYNFLDSSFDTGTDIITDFGGIGKGSNPSASVIASLDTLQFIGSGLTAQNLQLTQNGNNLEITFENVANNKVILQNFKLENLDNLPATSSRPAIGNILFDGQTSITDSFDVFDANSTQTSLFNRNTVTFLNDLDNNITGFDNSNDVINGQGGDDIIDGKSGNDLLRGGAGNDTLIGGEGNDTLDGGVGNNSLLGGTGDDHLTANISTGNNTLNGGVGNDSLSAGGSTGDNLLFGGDGNDSLDISGSYSNSFGYSSDSRSLGNNTLNGGVGNDTLSASGSKGDNLLSGGDGDDSLNVFGSYSNSYGQTSDSRSSGNNTLNGGAGNDTLSAGGSTGDNLLSGGDGNDYLDISGDYSYYASYDYSDSRSSGNNTLEGGAGDDTLNASGSTGANLLDGGDGNDILIGGNGNDSLYGGAGTDTFAFNNYNGGVDSLYDFNAANELIQVSAAGFGGGLSPGSVSASQFVIGTSATTSNQRFIYNNTTGGLFFDQDGSASGFTQVKFAQLSAGLSLTENNFLVV
ncbi:MAG: calcium-binding protein [Nostoc sp. NMS7]|uniref:beta strand repeat-containing protein n=1 Tax=Nostoc sp. NMS7 TaxID=2815391 RepID=UPI0025F68107|nr:calcium-binding protein [Nostoc sp. NMS7]MBN3949518.1 calcium-binding protein [Nostoc sp. NMS7]